ncbi:hypothetical protein Taro_038098 [Colocasia esculenta]|uniref:MULE transposase domain-containing protein n=1 Tax=Colocasia esculenta TaxID=4460 RepID=A0A843WRP0_COLES|nr:hypothetical protein [Colocasia esculenta]
MYHHINRHGGAKKLLLVLYTEILEQAIICFTGTTQRFKRYFICFQTSAYGFEVGCRPMLFLDGTHIKQHRVQGVILAASVLNSNNELFIIAYSIADSETYDNWVWFLQNLKRALLSDRRIAFLSDRGTGLKEAIPDIFPNDHHGY